MSKDCPDMENFRTHKRCRYFKGARGYTLYGEKRRRTGRVGERRNRRGRGGRRERKRE